MIWLHFTIMYVFHYYVCSCIYTHCICIGRNTINGASLPNFTFNDIILKLAVLGVFIPWKLANTTIRSFWFSPESWSFNIYQYVSLYAHMCLCVLCVWGGYFLSWAVCPRSLETEPQQEWSTFIPTCLSCWGGGLASEGDAGRMRKPGWRKVARFVSHFNFFSLIKL